MMEEILKAQTEGSHAIESIAKRILILTHKNIHEIGEEDVERASNSATLDRFTGGQLQEARQMLLTAVRQEQEKMRKWEEENKEESKDVVVEVKGLTLENPTEEDKKAKDFIERNIIPQIQVENTVVGAVMIYLPKKESAKTIVRREHVIQWANSVIKSAEKRYGHEVHVTPEDFMLIEYDIMGEKELGERQKEAEEKGEKYTLTFGDIRVTQLTD